MSFQEKSLWLLFVGLVGVFGFYFWNMLPVMVSTGVLNVMPNQVIRFAFAVGVLVITQVVGHSLLAAIDRHTETDERDKLIELKGTRNGAYVLAIGVFTSLCTALVTEGNFIFTHTLLGFWVLAQLTEIASQLFLYRRGV